VIGLLRYRHIIGNNIYLLSSLKVTLLLNIKVLEEISGLKRLVYWSRSKHWLVLYVLIWDCNNDLFTNLDKFEYNITKVDILGALVSHGQIYISPEKVLVVLNYYEDSS
jgi:hypothetical protein